jgi:hypothetical protein
VGSLEHPSKAPAASPLMRDRVEIRRGKRGEEMSVFGTVRLPFLLKLRVSGVEFQVEKEHVASC